MNIAEESKQSDERVVWVRQSAGRRIVQIIEPHASGFSVATEWWEGGTLTRRDVHIAVRGVSSGLEAQGFR